MPAPNNNQNNKKNDSGNKKSTIGFLSIILWALVFVMLMNTCTGAVRNASTIEVSYGPFRQWWT